MTPGRGGASMSGDRHHLEKGDLVVVTGAAQGIGRAIALRLTADGARVALWDVLADGLAETAALIKAAGGEAVTRVVDTSDDAAVVAAAATLDGTAFGLVNNAGIFPRATILEADAALWRRVLNVNLVGHFLCAKSVLPGMVKAGRGSIVNISSGAALAATPQSAHYSASKAGILSFTKSLAVEFGPHVRANCVMPGLIETAQPLLAMNLDTLHGYGRTTPLGRAGQPDDIAKVVSFLMSDAAGYMTGQSISVNGGGGMTP